MEIDVADNEQKLIQQQMEETRASLSTKLEALENQVAETVQTATDAVQTTKEAVAETVGTVKESVDEIRDKVGETVRTFASFFDINRQAEDRPWVLFGGSIGIGCLVGWYLPKGGRAQAAAVAARASFAAHVPEPAATPPPKVPSEPAKPSWIGKEISRLRGLAIGVAMGTVRDLVKQNLPEAFSARVAEEVDKLTPELGGEVFHGQILPDLQKTSDNSAPESQSAPTGTSRAYASSGAMGS